MSEIIERVAQAFRQIGQPDTDNLVFVCAAEDEDYMDMESILGIPLFRVPFLNVLGGLLLATKGDAGYDNEGIGYRLIKFQEYMEE